MDSDEETEDVKGWKGVPGTIILLNAFGNSKYNTFPIAHVATCRLIRQYLRLSGSHNVSVCIYGTEDAAATGFDSKSVIEIFPLTMPTIHDFKKLQNVDISAYLEAKELKLSEVLWHCSKTFSNFKKQLSSRSIIMLTELRTAPIGIDQKPTLKKVMDLVDSNVHIKIINISNEPYTIDSFYENFLLEANKGQEYKVPPAMWDVKEIENVMYQESHRHLALAKLDFEIGNGLSIGVGVYSLLKRSGYVQQKQTYLERDTNAMVTNVTKTMKVTMSDDMDEESEASGSKEVPLLKSEILHFLEYGGERIEFTESEINKIKNPFGSPMIKLLGFKPASIVCKEKWFYKSSYFLFPNEASIEGSTVAFNALHQACREMSVVAFCVLCTRVNSKPIIVALSPTSRPLGINVDVGFDVIIIPFVENVRDISEVTEDNSDVNVDEASKSVMRDILNSMKFDYKPIENPKQQSIYRALESIALEDEEQDTFVDTTQPDPSVFENIREDLFEEIFGPFQSVSVKRSANTTKSEQGSSKRLKTESIDEDLLASRINSKDIKSYTVDQLKNILRYKDIKNLPALTGLKKTELVDLVYKHCSN